MISTTAAGGGEGATCSPSTAASSVKRGVPMGGIERIVLEDGDYLVVVVEDDPFWVWTIFCGDDEVYSGCSISEQSACSASMAIFRYLRGRS